MDLNDVIDVTEDSPCRSGGSRSSHTTLKSTTTGFTGLGGDQVLTNTTET